MRKFTARVKNVNLLTHLTQFASDALVSFSNFLLFSPGVGGVFGPHDILTKSLQLVWENISKKVA